MDFISRKPEIHAIANSPVAVKNDELHVIMEYTKNSKWGTLPRPKRANRFIISSDVTNAAISTLEPLNQHVTDSDRKVDLLIAGGFNMLEGQTQAYVTTN